MITKEDVRLIKEKILKCLTEDFTFGHQPIRKKQNWSIFDVKDGHARYCGTDLQMVMDKVVLGLYFAMDEKEK